MKTKVRGTSHVAERGGALVMSLIAVSTVVVLAAGFTQFAAAVANRQAQAVDRKRAFYLAEAGLAEAFGGLACGRSGNVGTPESPAILGDGLFWVEASELEPDVLRLESTGMVGSGRAQLSLVAQRGEEGVAALGVFSAGNVSLSAGSTFDAYDSSKVAPYASQLDHSGATLGSSADILLTGSTEAPTTVNGNVIPGPENTVQSTGSVTITGSSNPRLSATELPPVEVPELSLEPAQKQASPYPLVIPSGRVGYQGLSVESGSQVVIQGPADVVLGALALQESAELAFDTTQGPVRLYVTDSLDLAEGSLLTTTGTHPEDVWIQVAGETAEPVQLRSSGAFTGVIYAPEAPVTVGGSFELFGALIADALTFEGPAKLHFDRHLSQLAADESLPVLLSWRIIDLGNTTGDGSPDPFRYLGLDRNTLVRPAMAYEDQFLVIDYYDAGLVYHTYSGPESRFDWSVVNVLIQATRDGDLVVFPRSPTARTGLKIKPATIPVVDGPML